jgi:hypothetical protein
MKKVFIVAILQTIILLQASEIQNPVSLAVTVYNDAFAIVKDTRSVSFD